MSLQINNPNNHDPWIYLLLLAVTSQRKSLNPQGLATLDPGRACLGEHERDIQILSQLSKKTTTRHV